MAREKPIRKGKIYCTPSCGMRCTYQQYKYSRDRAKKIKDILGKGWRIHVRHNHGWRASVLSKDGWWEIWRYGEGFIADISDIQKQRHTRWSGGGRTPKSAMKKALSNARCELTPLVGAVKEAAKALDKKINF